MALRGLFRFLGAIVAVSSLTVPALAEGMIQSAVDDQCKQNNARLTVLKDELKELENTPPAIPVANQQKAKDVLDLLNVPLAMSDFVVDADFQKEMAIAAGIFGYDWKACAFGDLRACTLGFQNKLREQLADVDDLKFKIEDHKAQIQRVETNLIRFGCVPAVITPAGQWKTDYGTIEFTGEHDIVGTYGAGGHLTGEMGGKALTGNWWSTIATPQKCKGDYQGTHYYGSYKFEFDLAGKEFKGTVWNCEESSKGKPWDGKYVGP